MSTLALLLWSGAFSQPFDFRSYQVEKGLSNNTVTCSLQDKRGFMWFGTKDGLNRFDGLGFKVFRQIAGDSNSIGNNSITQLLQDKHGVLWAGTERGLYMYNEEKENFSFLYNSLSSYIQGIANDSHGNLWFISKFRLFKYEAAGGKITEYPLNNDDYYTSVCSDISGNIWVASGHGQLGLINKAEEGFTFYPLFGHSAPPVSTFVEKVFDSGEGFLLIGTSNQGVKQFDLASRTYSDILTYNEDGTEIFVRNFIKSSRYEYWIGTESGIYIYDTRTRRAIHLKKNYNNPYALTDNAIYSLSRDREGGLWIGTYFGGINYYSNQHLMFEKYFPQVGQNSISGNAVREIVQDSTGNIWIGTEDAGLNKFNPRPGRFENYQPGRSPHSIAHTNIHGLLIDGNVLWIGTFEHGLDKMDLHTGKVIRHYVAGADVNSLKSNFIYSLYKTRAGQIFLATSNGFYHYDRKKDDFHLLPFLPFNTFYSAVLEDDEDTLWIATFNAGLFYYNPAKQIFGHCRVLSHGEDALAKTRITRLYEDRQHNTWISTENGLYCLNREHSFLRFFSDKNGLPSNLIYNTLEDKQGNLFVTTSKGLARYDFNRGIINVFSQASGLLTDQFNYNSGFIDSSGKMYFGSVKGMITFRPDGFQPNNYTPPVYFTGFQTFNKEAAINQQGSPLSKSIVLTQKITLPYNQATFSIEFSALTFSSPGNVKYAYQMRGVANAWNYIGTNNRIYFTNLPPNTYQLSVRSGSSNGRWSNNIVSICIEIMPPWWKSTAAYLLYIALLLIVAWLVFRSYHNRQLAKQQREMELFEIKKEKEFYQSKIDFFTKVAHEIRTPLTLIRAPMEKMLKQVDNLPKFQKYLLAMNRNTARLLTLTNQLLDFRKIESGHFLLNPTCFNVTELIRDSCAIFQSAAEQKDLQMQFIAADTIFVQADEESTIKIISNLLDNAVKYGKSKIIAEIQPLKLNDKWVTISVSNDGNLIPGALHDKVFEPFFRMKENEKASGTGIGLSLARSLSQLQRGDLTITTAQGLNTFILTLPV
jgi:ligand-binding sensor domain-containing protein/signal transduction histidine kinase